MSYLPAGFDVPAYLPHERGFAAACFERRLGIQRCLDCGRFRHPPQPRCAHCRSDRSDWAEVAGTGEVYSWTVVWHAANPALRGSVPYNVVVVLLDGTDGVRLVSNLVDVAPEDLRVGLRVELVWERRGEIDLPCFRLASREGGCHE
jgi:uncharacterized OB-fold protein